MLIFRTVITFLHEYGNTSMTSFSGDGQKSTLANAVMNIPSWGVHCAHYVTGVGPVSYDFAWEQRHQTTFPTLCTPQPGTQGKATCKLQLCRFSTQFGTLLCVIIAKAKQLFFPLPLFLCVESDNRQAATCLEYGILLLLLLIPSAGQVWHGLSIACALSA